MPVSKTRVFLKYWLPPIIWMALIFSASSDSKSFVHSSRIIAPLMHWLFPHASEDTVNTVVVVFRKCAHLSEYAVLAFLFWRALRRPEKIDSRPWSWRLAAYSVMLVAAYASTDEFHQLFVPTRHASIIDVMIDTTGAAIGMLALWALWICRGKHQSPKPEKSSFVNRKS